MKKSWEDAKAALRLAGETMKRHYDKSKRPPHAFKVGDLVLVDALCIQSDRPAKKLDDKRHGPFKILEKVRPSAYRLELLPQWKCIHPVFNEAKLTLFVPPYADHQKRQNDRPPPDIIEEKEEYEVEKILEHWDSGQKNVVWNFKVKWKGYPISECTWEKDAAFHPRATHILTAYKTRFPDDFPPTAAKTCQLQFDCHLFPSDFFERFQVSRETFTEPPDDSMPSKNFLSRQLCKSQQASRLTRG
jgi:hypothetical protein